jgi:hypothetical protein
MDEEMETLDKKEAWDLVELSDWKKSNWQQMGI